MSIFVNFLVAGCGAFFGGGVRKLLSDWLNGDDKPFPVGRTDRYDERVFGNRLLRWLDDIFNLYA